MRKLNKAEKELTKRNLEKNIAELEILKQNLLYNLALLEKQRYLREFDNKWRSYLQSQKDKEDNKVIEVIKGEIELREKLISVSEYQLKNGVEEKKNSIVQ